MKENTPWDKAFRIVRAERRQQELKKIGAPPEILAHNAELLAEWRAAVKGDKEVQSLMLMAEEAVVANEKIVKFTYSNLLLGQLFKTVDDYFAAVCGIDTEAKCYLDQADLREDWFEFLSVIGSLSREEQQTVMGSLYVLLGNCLNDVNKTLEMPPEF